MRKLKFAILISIVLIGGIVLVMLWGNLNEEKPSKEEEAPLKISTEGADARLEKIRFVEEKQGQKTWELEAKSIQQYQDQNVMVVEEVKMTLFSKEGRTFVISGNQGKVYQDSKNMELLGNVVLASSDGYQLKTHSISYHHSDRKVTSPDPVEIEGEQIRVEGKGMWVDMEGKVFRVLSQVKTRWKGGRKG
ncbi:MAG: LPS export ABC transporter periplasmic protein LptC [Thermodesulfobacteriota bacterium]